VNRVLRRIFGPKREEVRGNGVNYMMRSSIAFGEQVKGNEMVGACSMHDIVEQYIQNFSRTT
jgi:hypothetical protein